MPSAGTPSLAGKGAEFLGPCMTYCYGCGALEGEAASDFDSMGLNFPIKLPEKCNNCVADFWKQQRRLVSSDNLPPGKGTSQCFCEGALDLLVFWE